MIALYLSLLLQILARGMLTIFSGYSFYDMYLFLYQNLYIFFLHMIFYRKNKYNYSFMLKCFFLHIFKMLILLLLCYSEIFSKNNKSLSPLIRVFLLIWFTSTFLLSAFTVYYLTKCIVFSDYFCAFSKLLGVVSSSVK